MNTVYSIKRGQVFSLMWVVMLLLLDPVGISAQTNDAIEIPVFNASRVSIAMTIDGALDEPAWNQAQAASDFTQYEPDEGSSPTYPTEVKVLYDDRAIYIGAVMYDDQPDQMVRKFSRRDDIAQVDRFWVSIDSRLNRKTAYTFAVSSAGVQADGIIDNSHRRQGGGGPPGSGPRGPFDTSWDAVWYSDVQITSEGWVVEMEIPYSMLRFTEAESQVWGINFHRNIERLSEIDEWVYIPRTVQDYVANFGQLQGLENIEPRRNVQLKPYILTKKVNGIDPEPVSAKLGGAFKLGINAGTTFDATFNPDFGQVESDPAVLNLGTFETIFEEKRPFFLEGADIFDFQFGGFRDGQMLYTRRIGGDRSPIISSVKLTGQTENNLAFGVLGAATGEEYTPGRYYLASRLRRDFGSTSYIGVMLNGFQNEEQGWLERQTFTGGLDWNFRFAEDSYEVQGFVAGSHLRSKFFENMSEFNEETGLASFLEVGKVVGNFTYNGSITIYDDKFQPNDLGSLRQNDLIRGSVNVRNLLNNNNPFGPFRRGNVGMFLNNMWAYNDGMNRGLGGRFISNWTLKTFQEFSVDLDFEDVGGFDVRETRGLGPFANYSKYALILEFQSDSRKRYQLRPSLEIGTDDNRGSQLEARLGGRWDITSNFTISGSVNQTANSNITAWMANEPFLRQDGTWYIGPSNTRPDEANPEEFTEFEGSEQLNSVFDLTDGNSQYAPVFGNRDTREFGITLRGDIAFNAVLSLQIFNQLFVARGHYTDTRILTSPDNFESFSAYPKQQDFSLESYILNAVLRWEYSPGSTIYLVWSQNRAGESDSPLLDPNAPSPYDVTTGDQIRNTFDLYPNNVFILKVDYTFLW